jgi:hypothetical protein
VICAAIHARDNKTVSFPIGAGHYGLSARDKQGHRAAAVPSLSIDTLLRPYPTVDLLDLDVQVRSRGYTQSHARAPGRSILSREDQLLRHSKGGPL